MNDRVGSSTNPLVSFFFSTHNRKKTTIDTINYLYQQKYRPIEIVVVDDNSNDGTSDEIVERFPDVHLIRQTINIGGIAGRNIACKHTTGKYVVSLDDDSFPGEYCILRMVKEFESNPLLGLIAFNVYNHKSFIDNYYNENHLPAERFVSENYYWSGCGGGYRSKIVKKYGYWEEWGHTSPYELAIASKVMKLGMISKNYSDIYVYHCFASSVDSSLFYDKWAYPVETCNKSRVGSLGNYTSFRNIILYVFKFYPINLKSLLIFIRFAWIASFDVVQRKRFLFVRAYFNGFSKINIMRKERIAMNQLQIDKVPITFNFKGK